MNLTHPFLNVKGKGSYHHMWFVLERSVEAWVRRAIIDWHRSPVHWSLFVSLCLKEGV